MNLTQYIEQIEEKETPKGVQETPSIVPAKERTLILDFLAYQLSVTFNDADREMIHIHLVGDYYYVGLEFPWLGSNVCISTEIEIIGGTATFCDPNPWAVFREDYDMCLAFPSLREAVIAAKEEIARDAATSEKARKKEATKEDGMQLFLGEIRHFVETNPRGRWLLTLVLLGAE